MLNIPTRGGGGLLLFAYVVHVPMDVNRAPDGTMHLPLFMVISLRETFESTGPVRH
jgi:hypothetical protein